MTGEASEADGSMPGAGTADPSDDGSSRRDGPVEASSAGREAAREQLSMDVARPDDETGIRRRRWLAIGAGAALLATAFVFLVDPATPAIERSSVVIATVERGTLVRRVRAPGTLVPRNQRIVSAVTAGRVEQVRTEPGERVDSATVLLELSNPDVELEALQARKQLTEATSRLFELREQIGTEILEQRSTVADARATARAARRRADADSVLRERELIARNRALRSREEARAAETRLETSESRLAMLERVRDARLEAQRGQVDRLRSIRAYHRRRVESMQVRAGVAGVVQDLDLEPGQWIQPGTVLAVVAEPDRLKAELRVPQTEAREVRPGQDAVVDIRSDTIPGRVQRVNPDVQDGSVLVEVALEGPLPQGARPDLTVDGFIELERLEDVLHVARPARAREDGRARVFRLEPDGGSAVRSPVRFGAGSVERIQVRQGLESGDRIVVSSLDRFEDAERIRIE
jgi:multidrug efflux pump subunit AcrA (membrane-fusion protein)